jgi:hypothetical protein
MSQQYNINKKLLLYRHAHLNEFENIYSPQFKVGFIEMLAICMYMYTNEEYIYIYIYFLSLIQ